MVYQLIIRMGFLSGTSFFLTCNPTLDAPHKVQVQSALKEAMQNVAISVDAGTVALNEPLKERADASVQAAGGPMVVPSLKTPQKRSIFAMPQNIPMPKKTLKPQANTYDHKVCMARQTLAQET